MSKRAFMVALLCSAGPSFAAPVDQIYAGMLENCDRFTGGTYFLHIEGDDEAMLTLRAGTRMGATEETHKAYALSHQDFKRADATLSLSGDFPVAGRYPQSRNYQLSNLASGRPVVSLTQGDCTATLAPMGSFEDYKGQMIELGSKAGTSPQNMAAYLRWRDTNAPAAILGDQDLVDLASTIAGELRDEDLAYHANVARMIDRTADPALLPALREILERQEYGAARDLHLANLNKAILHVSLALKTNGQNPRDMAATTPAQICDNRGGVAQSQRYYTSTVTGLPMEFWDDALHERYLTMVPSCKFGEEFTSWLQQNQKDHRSYRLKGGWLVDQLALMNRTPMTLGAVEAAGFFAYDPEGLQKYAITQQDQQDLASLRDALVSRTAERLGEELLYELRIEMPPLADYPLFCGAWAAPHREVHPHASDVLNAVVQQCEVHVAHEALGQYQIEMEERAAAFTAAEAAQSDRRSLHGLLELSDLKIADSLPQSYLNLRGATGDALRNARHLAIETLGPRAERLGQDLMRSIAAETAKSTISLQQIEKKCLEMEEDLRKYGSRIDDNVVLGCLNAASATFGQAHYSHSDALVTQAIPKAQTLADLKSLEEELQKLEPELRTSNQRYWGNNLQTVRQRNAQKLKELRDKVLEAQKVVAAGYLPLEQLTATALVKLPALCTDISASLPEAERAHFTDLCLTVALPHKQAELDQASGELEAELTKVLVASIPDAIAFLVKLDSLHQDPELGALNQAIVMNMASVKDDSLPLRLKTFLSEQSLALSQGFDTVTTAEAPAHIQKAEAACAAMEQMPANNTPLAPFCTTDMPQRIAAMENRFACDASLSKAPDVIREGLIEISGLGLTAFAQLICEAQTRKASFSYASEGFWNKEWFLLRTVEVNGTPFELRAQVLPFPDKEGQFILGNLGVSPATAQALPQTSFDITKIMFAPDRDLKILARP